MISVVTFTTDRELTLCKHPLDAASLQDRARSLILQPTRSQVLELRHELPLRQVVLRLGIQRRLGHEHDALKRERAHPDRDRLAGLQGAPDGRPVRVQPLVALRVDAYDLREDVLALVHGDLRKRGVHRRDWCRRRGRASGILALLSPLFRHFAKGAAWQRAAQ